VCPFRVTGIEKGEGVKVKPTLEQAMKAQRGNRGVVLLFL
jgi:hypothetical protein